MLKKLFFLAAAALLPFAAIADDKAPYNEAADAKADVAVALKTAGAEKKLTLVVFGANWCGDCKMLDAEMKKGDLAKLVGEKYVVVKVDVGRFVKNLDVAEQTGTVLKKGIPAIAILKPDGKPVYQTNGGELADARKMGGAGITKFFEDVAGRAKS
jgi:thioredoxin 1